MRVPATADVTGQWVPPGPGTWELDTAHYPPTVSRIARDIIEHCCTEGLRQGFDLLGAPLSTLQARFVHGRFYMRMVPIVGGDRDAPPPPAWALRSAFRVVPKLRRRAAAAEQALAAGSWRSEFDAWTSVWKPELIAANRRFGAVDETALTDIELARHLDALYAHLLASTTLHFRLHTSDLGPIGLMLVATRDWGLDEADVMEALAGSSPATSAPSAAMDELRAELRSVGSDPGSLADVRAASPLAAELLDGYLAEYGSRLTTGYDIRDSTLAELPDLVFATIVDTRSDDRDLSVGSGAAARGEEAFGRLRAQLPNQRRAEFDELVADARLTYGLRDENGPLTYEWPAGVVRRVVLETARRLVGRGRVADVEHVFDASAAELSAILRGFALPSADDLAARCADRMAWAEVEAPATLGPPAPDPPLDALPAAMATMMRVNLAVMELLQSQAAAGLEGAGIGSEPYRGIARVVADADDALERAEPGDVIVARLTVPTFNSVLAMAGAVVTEHGGLLCHTAVIARELGIPAVVGVAGALTAIPDGAEVEVDPIAGCVTVLSPAPLTPPKS